jgi:type I restriction-modification system DNA methylase subunit
MQDLFSHSPAKSSYFAIYKSLSTMRELFHQIGRFDDSNAKLDEVVKIVAMYLAYRRGLLKQFPNPDEPNLNLIAVLQALFEKTAKLECYLNQDGTSIFGSNPLLSLRTEDEALARFLISLVRTAIDAALLNKELDHPFDVLNEAFGHFIRDNFRGNIEDAQYMTPPEVVDLMVSMVLEDIDRSLAPNLPIEQFVVLDPTCGVGSFLAAFYHKSRTSKVLASCHKIKLVGQDKVERMIRLTKINLALFGSVEHQVTIGNSLSKDSPLTALNGTVDLILTNPPFGAKFTGADIASFGKHNLTLFASNSDRFQSVNSELLFIDRNLSLLRDGGRLLIIVPDSVISARGLPALLRQQLRSVATVRAVIELPSVTFAQAGTRTKTCIFYLIKGKHHTQTVFVARSEGLGFEVSSRKGVQVKIQRGSNDLPAILNAYKLAAQQTTSRTRVIIEKPSSVNVAYAEFINGSWTPNHYSASRLNSVMELENLPETRAIPLYNLVEFQSDKRASEPYTEDSYFISVLHIIGDGMLDIRGVKTHRPKTPGIRVNPGEVIFSRINPRIPRAFVIPDFGRKILCSSEFEVMSAKPGIDPYLVTFLLLSNSVHEQVRSLTSGTSASHNRIKTSDLANILLPVPIPGTNYETRLSAVIDKYRKTIGVLVEQMLRLSSIREEHETLNNEHWIH